MAHDYASSTRGAWLIDLLRTTSVPLPDVRRMALIESCRVAPDDEALVSLFLDAISGSPYVSDEHKSGLAEIMLSGRWDALLVAMQCDVGSPDDPGRGDPFHEFRAMATMVFTKSKKVARLPEDRRRALGGAIIATTSRDQLVALMIRSLEKAETLDAESRAHIANDVFDGMFHRLLLPDRFDCDEIQRRAPAPCGVTDGAGRGMEGNEASHPEEPVECPICLGVNDTCGAGSLPCGHSFCEDCIVDWAQTHGDPFPCPMCRVDCKFGPHGFVAVSTGLEEQLNDVQLS